jgi:hypothetical protein
VGVEECEELVDIAGRDCEELPLALTLTTFGALVSTRKHAREWSQVLEFPSFSFVSSSKYHAIKRNASRDADHNIK